MRSWLLPVTCGIIRNIATSHPQGPKIQQNFTLLLDYYAQECGEIDAYRLEDRENNS
jgi:hypothetical protein